MCLNPLTIKNPAKVISTKYRDRYLIQVPCGHCEECNRSNSLAWYHRTVEEFSNCVHNNGYVLFDCLTYDNQNLPHMSDFIPELSGFDYPCFSYVDIRNWLKRLRKSLKDYDVKHNLRFFVTSEYGTSPLGSHRPHYHVLFFVYGSVVPPLVLSKHIRSTWNKGRTDGVDDRGPNYVLSHCVFRKMDDKASFLTAQYVSKYVGKSFSFAREIDKRVSFAFDKLAEAKLANLPKDKRDRWLKSSEARKLRLSLKRMCDQFHRQSLGFGASMLENLDISYVFKYGSIPVTMPDRIVVNIPLSTYFKRKLFYELVEFDGYKTWQLTDIGKAYVESRHDSTVALLAKRFREVDSNHSNVLSKLLNDRTFEDLAIYITDFQGRVKSDLFKNLSYEDKIESDHLFNYITLRDVDHFGFPFLSSGWLGHKDRYLSWSSFYSYISPTDFISDKVITDTFKPEFEGFDSIYDLYRYLSLDKSSVLQFSAEEVERLTNLYRELALF